MNAKLMIVAVALAAFAARAESISGSGDYVIDGNALIVSNGTVSVDAPLSVTTVRINEGATLKIGTDTPFDEAPALLLFGTLDLNGHSLSVAGVKTRHPEGDSAYCIYGKTKDYYIASTEALITNSVASSVTLTTTGGTVQSGAAVASNVKMSLTGTELAQLSGRCGGSNPKQIEAKADVLTMTRPTELIFVFKESAIGESRLRLNEMVPTFKGVPISELGYTVSCTIQTPGVTWATTYAGRWTDGDLAKGVFLSDSATVSPEKPHIMVVTLSGRGFPPVDGYRLGTPNEPGYSPKTWNVYVVRNDDLGAVLVDQRKDDLLNRPELNTATDKDDAWSNQLTDNYVFKWPLGAAVGADTDLNIVKGMRFSEGGPVALGAVSGAGKITLDQDSVICPESLADWTGVFSVDETYGFLGEGPGVLLSSGAAEQKFAYENVNLSVGVAETNSTVKVLYDETTADTYARTRLRDGAGTLGVTVRAPGKEQYLAAQGSDYTGPTDVESGTLVVHGKGAGVTCSYIKIVVKKVPHTDNYSNCYWGMNEFAVYDESGAKINLANATVKSSTSFINDKTNGPKLVDGDETSRMLPSGGSLDDMPTVTIPLPQPVTFAAYDWYPSVNNGSPTTYRYPLELEIWVSSDNVNWMLADKRTNAQPSTNADYKKFQGGENHFALNFGTTDLPTLDAAVRGASSERASFVESVKARYFRFTCFETFYGWNFLDPTNKTDKGWGMSEFALLKNGASVDWPTNNAAFSVTNESGLVFWSSGAQGSANEKIADNIRTGVNSGADQNRALYSNGLGYLQIDAGEELEFDAYSLWTPSPSSAVKRLPRGWMLQVSANGTNWHTVDVHRPAADDVCPTSAYREYGPFSLKNRWPIPGAGNVIGDKSKVTVAEGATLRLDAASEYVGGLAGEGTVNLKGHTLGLFTQDTNTVFSGAVEGAGTLVISGEGEQAFEGADLSGVSTLKLAGGAMTGSASFDGSDLSLDFAGGALGASLLNIGALTVTGDVVIRPPAAAIAAKKNWTATITTGTAMDEETQKAFANAQFIGLPRSMKPSVEVGANCVTFTVVRSGLIFILR